MFGVKPDSLSKDAIDNISLCDTWFFTTQKEIYSNLVGLFLVIMRVVWCHTKRWEYLPVAYVVLSRWTRGSENISALSHPARHKQPIQWILKLDLDWIQSAGVWEGLLSLFLTELYHLYCTSIHGSNSVGFFNLNIVYPGRRKLPCMVNTSDTNRKLGPVCSHPAAPRDGPEFDSLASSIRMVKDIKYNRSGRKIRLIPTISAILWQMWYHCV